MNLNATNPGVEPKTLAFLRALETQGGPPLYELPLAKARAVAASAQAMGVVKLPIDIEDRTIPGGPNGQIGIRILRPKGSAGVLPVVMYFHGGAGC